MLIYVAAPWVRRADARHVTRQLQQAGHLVTSHWVHLTDEATDPDTSRAEALKDLSDLERADALVCLNLEVSEGKAVETGVALALGRPVYLVGAPSNIFHHLPQVRVVESVDALLPVLRA